MNFKLNLLFSRFRAIVGIIFWSSPCYLLLPQLPTKIEHLINCVQFCSGVVFFLFSLFLIDYKYDKIKLLLYIFLLFPVSLILYMSEILFLTIISIQLYGIPADVL